MNLSQDEIDRFRAAWEQDFGEKVTLEFAAAELQRLLTFLHLLSDGLFGPGRVAGTGDAGRDTMER